MEEIILKLEELLKKGREYFQNHDDQEISYKPSKKKWSKKETLGHLIDSGINNLQRFTEIQFESKPYQIRKYDQDKLVKVNDYQNSDVKEMLDLWLQVNKRIINVIKLQTNKTRKYKVLIGENAVADLNFLIEDYVDHTEHHLDQITGKK